MESTVTTPSTERLLLGPGPSPVSSRVRAALGAPPLSHLDPDLMAILDGIRARLERVFRAPDGALTLAVSGTGTSGMETVIANLVTPGARALVIVTGYFGERMAALLARYGANVERLDVEWGRSADPDDVRRALGTSTVNLVAVVHAETSTGVRNPVREIASLAHEHGALVIVDAVTSLGAMPLDIAAWDVDACFSCSQKGLGAPSGLAPIVLAPRALGRRTSCRSFYFDLALLEDYWVRRRYHHTISAPLIYALDAALAEVEEEGLEPRWRRHETVHEALVAALDQAGLSLLPARADRLWSLNAVRVPAGVDDAAVRAHLLRVHNIEIGAGLGPLAGKIWRIGLMGSGSTRANVDRVRDGLLDAIASTRPAPAASS
jgi:alanine-glyoxylate transaminase/serine-glyoxylate transaminase/serine-pyruvate transaminase